MLTAFRTLDDLPQRNATQVKNKWRDLVDQVRTTGSVAVTHHDKVEMVVMDVATYQEMVNLAAAATTRQRDVLTELTAEFDEQLASLQAPGTHDKIDAVMEFRGDLTKISDHPRAGRSY
jgi:PHD/YefM family antitoxin component YafN of YafNO toxin-antitoxin module